MSSPQPASDTFRPGPGLQPVHHPMPPLRRLLAAALLCLAAVGPVLASTPEKRDEAVFDFYVKGFRVGLLVFAGVQAGDYYAVNGRFSTAGLAALVKKTRYDATVHGTVNGGGYHPDEYVLTTNPGPKQKVQTIDFQGGAPKAPVQVPARAAPDPLAVDPAAQAGAIDTLTAIYATLRAMPEAEACKGSLILYDGVRRAKLTLWLSDGGADALTCGGEYRRIAGYSADDMAHPAFPFKMIYSKTAVGEVQVNEIDMESIYGPASLKRR